MIEGGGRKEERQTLGLLWSGVHDWIVGWGLGSRHSGLNSGAWRMVSWRTGRKLELRVLW